MIQLIVNGIEWLELHYKAVTGIVVPIIVAILGIFKFKKPIKSRNSVDGDNNGTTSGRDAISKDSRKSIAQNADGAATQIVGNYNRITSMPSMSDMKSAAEFYAHKMFPLAEKALDKCRLNSFNFLKIFEERLAEFTPEELEKFSEADVQVALQNAIRGAARKESREIHRILAQLIADRIQKPKQDIAQLAINESIAVAEKLDVNLMKMLAFSFLFSRTKNSRILHESFLLSLLSFAADHFQDLEVSRPRFEYLEAISCGKIVQFSHVDMVKTQMKAYPQLFLKNVNQQQITELAVSNEIENACFVKIADSDDYKINIPAVLCLFEDTIININGVPFCINEDVVKERLKSFFIQNQLSQKEVKEILNQAMPKFERMRAMWDEEGFSRFSLTAVGIAIGRAYLEQHKFGNYDINTWIN